MDNARSDLLTARLSQPWKLLLATLACLAALVVAIPAQAQTTFNNSSTILLPIPPGTGAIDNSHPGEPGSLYPSTITVTGMGPSISKLTVRINDFRHTVPDDIDMLLVGPTGAKMVIWSDVGGFNSTCGAAFDFLACNNTGTPGATGITVTLDDAATQDLTSQATSFVSGTYKPTNVGTASDSWPSPAPAPPYMQPQPVGAATFASTFNGSNPNGTWRLYVIDDSFSATGRIQGGWSLTITTTGGVLASTTTTITSDTPDPSDTTQSVSVAYTVTGAGGTPTGNVTVGDGINICSGTVAAGNCSLIIATPGNRTLTAQYAGDATFAASLGTTTHTVRYNTTTTITGDTPDPSDIGQPVVVTYTVTGPGATPTGTVTVADGFNSCQASIAAGTCTIASLTTPGDRTLTANYSGDQNNAASSATTAHRIRYNSTIAITADTPDPSTAGQVVTVAYTVTSSGGPAATGNVTVTDGVASCIGTAAAGSCNITLSTLGARTLTATYAGDGFTKNSASAGAAHQVNAAPPGSSTTSITGATPDPSDIGQAVTVTYTVAAAGGTPTGTLTVSDGVASCSGAVLAGQCVIASMSVPGDRTLTASYAGDANFAASSGTALHRVRYNTTTTISGHTPNPSSTSQSVSVSFVVAATQAGGPAPTGNVTVTDGVSSCTGTAASGSCTVTLITAGARTLVATFAGDGFNKGSASAGIAHTVSAPAADLTIVKSHPAAFTQGQMGALYTITVSNAGSASTNGTVTVTDTLPLGLTATAISGAGWSCSQPGGSCTRADPLAAGGSYPGITLVVNVAANAPVSVTNVATVNGGGDANTSNNTASDPTAIGTLGSFTLTVIRAGSGIGMASSQDGGINCGTTCSKSYAAGTVVTLAASPLAGSTFSGWSEACSGAAGCSITMTGNLSATATFAPATAATRYLDIDNNSQYDALTDALIVGRYLFGLTGAALTSNAIGPNAQRSDPAQVLAYLDSIRPMLDIDGNGQVDALTDGLLVMRHMFGLRGTALTQGALGAGATRNATQIDAYMLTLQP